MKIREYLYVDHGRIDDFFSQVSPDPKLTKLTGWKAGLSVTGPVVEGSQTSAIREFSTHEKIEILLKELSPHTGSPPFDWFKGSDFAVQRGLVAQRIHIPRSASRIEDFPGLVIWMCRIDSDTPKWNLLLIEDYYRANERRGHRSGATSLSLLIEELAATLDDDFIGDPTMIGEFEGEAVSEVYKLAKNLIESYDKPFIWDDKRQEEVERALQGALERFGIMPSAGSVNWWTIYDDGGLGFNFEMSNKLHGVTIPPPTDELLRGCRMVVERVKFTAEELQNCFMSDAPAIFARWGASVGPIRRIDSFYIARTTEYETKEYQSDGYQMYRDYPFVGYPLFVAAHRGS